MYIYKHFIPENIAPSGAKRIGVYKDGKRICTVPLGQLAPVEKTPLYSFGLVSDMHLSGTGDNGRYLSEAMTFFENQGCSFCCHCGDMTNIGFWSSSSTEIYLTQMAEYKSVIDAHPNLPMYGICGNHESYNKSITENLTELKAYTYRDLYYTYEHGNDVFIFIGQPWGTGRGLTNVWNEEFAWLKTTLEANKGKRCFVFEHLTLSDDSGNPNNIHNAYLYEYEPLLIEAMQQYPNAILFHGHSHLALEEQVNFSYANYNTGKGFKSVHVPSPAGNRITVDGEFEVVNGAKPTHTELREGYVVDVYADCVVLNGWNLSTDTPVGIAQYCISAF